MGQCPAVEAATAGRGTAGLKTSKAAPATDLASAADVSCPSTVRDHLGIPGWEKVLRLAELLHRLANEQPSAELIQSIAAAHENLDICDREPLRFPRVVKRPTLGRFKSSVRKPKARTGAEEIARYLGLWETRAEDVLKDNCYVLKCNCLQPQFR